MGRFPLENSADDSDEDNVVHHAKEQHEVNEFDADVVFVRSEHFEGAVAEEEEHEREESESQQLVLDDLKEVAVNFLLELVLDVFNQPLELSVVVRKAVGRPEGNERVKKGIGHARIN